MEWNVLISKMRVKSFNLDGGGEEWCLVSAVLAQQKATGKSGVAALLGFLGMREAMIFRSVFGSCAGMTARLKRHSRYSERRIPDPRFCPP